MLDTRSSVLFFEEVVRISAVRSVLFLQEFEIMLGVSKCFIFLEVEGLLGCIVFYFLSKLK